MIPIAAKTEQVVDHDGQRKLTVWFDGDELTKLDEAIRAQGYKSRAEWLRDMARRTVRGE